ncbi:hypothetical protein ACIRF8_35620 [Streptomyces sp. NPDC102406]|uniref:hypothetical protein n=1 Tax=Streptomyces sp. NPDC102406 TaxID=3366171 RepID=UPI0037FD07CB
MTSGQQRKRFGKRLLGTAAASAFVLLAAAVGILAGPSEEADAANAAADTPGYAVEDFNYPQADKILTEKKLVLKRGDGHITLAECAPDTGQLELRAREIGNATFCFDVIGTEGWLTLEVPKAYSMKGNDYSTTVDMTIGDEKQSFDLKNGIWTGIGEIADPEHRDFTLVEIRTSK